MLLLELEILGKRKNLGKKESCKLLLTSYIITLPIGITSKAGWFNTGWFINTRWFNTGGGVESMWLPVTPV